MNKNIKKSNRFRRFVGRNKLEIKRLLMVFIALFAINFGLFTIDIFTESNKFFFQWPLLVSAILFVAMTFRTFLPKKRSLPNQKKDAKVVQEKVEQTK